MGHAARELADDFQLLRLAQGLFSADLVGDVAPEGIDGPVLDDLGPGYAPPLAPLGQEIELMVGDDPVARQHRERFPRGRQIVLGDKGDDVAPDRVQCRPAEAARPTRVDGGDSAGRGGHHLDDRRQVPDAVSVPDGLERLR